MMNPSDDTFEIEPSLGDFLDEDVDAAPRDLTIFREEDFEGGFELDVPPAQITAIPVTHRVRASENGYTLAPQQEEAIRTVAGLIKGLTPKPVTYLAGYAGTGKSTILPDLLETIGTPPEKVWFCAPTGKAAKVMREKLLAQGYANPNTTTIHSAIYRAKPAPVTALEADLAAHRVRAQTQYDHAAPEAGGRGYAALKADPEYQQLLKAIKRLEKELEAAYLDDKLSFQLNVDSLIQNMELIVVDEASMVGRQMADDLAFFGVPILAIGDPGQLPPVQDDPGLTAAEPDFFLTEIHRQAKDNPILHLATLARQGLEIPLGDYGNNVRVMRRKGSDGYDHDWDQPDQPQIICGMNKTRWKINQAARWGRSRAPEPDEPLIVCKNNKKHPTLVNGTPVWAGSGGEIIDGRATFPMVVRDEYGTEHQVVAFQGLFEETYLGKDNFTAPSGTVYRARQSALMLDWAYAITAHKSQGSQWDSVWVVDESSSFRQDADRWLYTAITRAAKELIITV